ncbi:polysaccharide deacetylase family protein [Hyphomicrobium sp.]|uniref:polysaccharide deacetylase family protein n=1 Tax=Hyphomicrobium sp. TaxID=82 RepID=UPI0025B81590|nr:polysaccharide deacetylase family protein [Hyphomicrobium sp.]MCC7251639.1 polysaccharide deacetylase family protein [Hyphomicrobium sp.]
MSASRCTWLALGFALATSAALVPCEIRAETPSGDPAKTTSPATLGESEQALTVNPAASAAAELKSTLTLDCADRPDVLGVSRVVEIDTTAGPEFGDQYMKVEPKFLEPGEVVLTFDDGPMRRYTRPILDALDEQCVKATFFAVGRMAISDPATLQEVARRGHTIGTHTWSHKNLSTLSAAAMKREFELGVSAVAAAAGAPTAPFFRFPYLGHSKATRDYIKSRGVGIFGIHVDSKDFRTKSPGVVLRNVLAGLGREKKGILLFHDIQPSTAGALTSLLEELKARGFKVVHMVAKHTPITLPEDDAIAEKALKAKSVAAANTPLADRAATWPVSGAEPDDGASAPPAKSSGKAATQAPRPAKPFDWANPSNDPWQLKAFGSD